MRKASDTGKDCSAREPWPGKIPAGRISDEIVHGVDLFPTLARITGARVPDDRPVDGVDQSGFFLGESDKSKRERILATDNGPEFAKVRLKALSDRVRLGTIGLECDIGRGATVGEVTESQ